MSTAAGVSHYNLEYRSTKDDAWYSARVLLDAGTLTVKFKDFPETFNDEVFCADNDDFATLHDVSVFLGRFRLDSVPYDDHECSRIIEGVRVCAAYKDDGLFRFFDAIVDAIHNKEHSTDKCMCTFLLLWQHGPQEGYITSASISDMCRIVHGPVDEKVTHFRDRLNEKLRKDSSPANFASGNLPSCNGLAWETEKSCLPNETKSSLPEHKLQDMESAKKFSCRTLGAEDRDMGGVEATGCHHYIVLENLEKDLSPLSITEFINKQMMIAPQAYVFPCLSLETYARGAIVLDSKRELKRVYEFITNPDHFIVSWKGRPWIIADNKLRVATSKPAFGSLLPGSKYKFKNKDIASELKIVYSGTEEYMRAKRLKDLFLEFHNHLTGLGKTLAVEEKRLLCLLPTV